MTPNELIKRFKIEILVNKPDRLHTAPDVDTDKIRDDFVINRHRRADCAPGARMNVRHDTDFTPLNKRLIAQRLYLIACRLFQILRKDLGFVVLPPDDDHIVLRSEHISLLLCYIHNRPPITLIIQRRAATTYTEI